MTTTTTTSTDIFSSPKIIPQATTTLKCIQLGHLLAFILFGFGFGLLQNKN